MTGKLADKLPLTMSSLINAIPDSLYPEEDIPTSMNIFTSTESINHYSQMNTGKGLIYFYTCVRVCFADGESGSSCAVRGRQQLSWCVYSSTCLRSGCRAQRQIPSPITFLGRSGVAQLIVSRIRSKMTAFRVDSVIFLSSSFPSLRLSSRNVTILKSKWKTQLCRNQNFVTRYEINQF